MTCSIWVCKSCNVAGAMRMIDWYISGNNQHRAIANYFHSNGIISIIVERVRSNDPSCTRQSIYVLLLVDFHDRSSNFEFSESIKPEVSFVAEDEFLMKFENRNY